MDFTPSLAEIWSLYGIGTILIAGRVFVRTKMVGFQGYRPDDYVIWLTWAVYTTVTVIAHVFIMKAGGMHTSLLTPEQRKAMPKEEYDAWAYGSKIFLVGFYSYAVIVWTLKFNMLCFYQRLVAGSGLWVRKAVYVVMGFVGVSAVAVILTFTLTCVPFHKMWQIYPDPGWLCVPQNTATFYTVLILNLVTDFCILLIPIPVILPMRVSVVRKVGFIILFGMGIFCMMAAIIRVVLIFKLNQQGISAMWSIREDFVAVFVTQAPMVYPMCRPGFWKKNNSYGSGTGMSHDNKKAGYGHQMSNLSRKARDPYSITQIGGTVIDKSESQEEMVKPSHHLQNHPGLDERRAKGLDAIVVTQTYDVETSTQSDSARGKPDSRRFSDA